MVVLGSVLFNIPRFLYEEPTSIVAGGRRVYFVFPGSLQGNAGVERAYWWTYFTLGIAIPLCVLVFCNAKLVVALRSSKKFEQSASVRNPATTSEEAGDHSASRITLTLIVIIAFFVLLFVPAELLNFFVEHAAVDVFHKVVFNVAQAVGNLLQSINFAVNFVLYCIVNRHFRHTMYRLAKCQCCRQPSPKRETMMSSNRNSRRAMIGGRENVEPRGRATELIVVSRTPSRTKDQSPSL